MSEITALRGPIAEQAFGNAKAGDLTSPDDD